LGVFFGVVGAQAKPYDIVANCTRPTDYQFNLYFLDTKH
jgi:hypothetical protein